MVSRENAVILGFGAAAFVLSTLVMQLPRWRSWLLLSTFVGVGVVCPVVVNGYLDART
jgi:hypothetical protein